jgi:S1-C subfamily serine protease
MRRLLCAACTILLPSVITGPSADVCAQVASSGADPARQLVVMIEGRLGGEVTTGSGIVFGAQAGRLYIATANHVVRRGAAEAQELTVRFWTLPGERLPAKLLLHADRGLDLAVLSVETSGEGSLEPGSFPFDRLGDAGVLERGDPVLSIGNPSGRPWEVSATPELFYNRQGDQLHFESSFIAGGSSGGGLFNHNAELLGMIRADQPPKGIAVSLDRLLETLGGWGYPVNFTTTAGIAGRWYSSGGWFFEFKVLGDELFGTVWEGRYGESLGILAGRVSRDVVSFHTLERFTVDVKIGETASGMAITSAQPGETRIQYRGTLGGDRLHFIMQNEDGRPPQEFALRRMPSLPGFLGARGQIVSRAQVDSLGLEQRAGVVIGEVDSGSPAQKAGLRPRDVILRWNGALLALSWQWPALACTTAAGEEATIQVVRDGAVRDVRIVLAEPPEGTASCFPS